MIVVVLSNCPANLRGDLTKWMIEVNTNVYVGQFSARVRDELWERICENVRSGQATMVFSAQGEQRMDFRVHNTSWEPVDYDGVKLMLHPSPEYLEKKGSTILKEGFSKASKQRKRKRLSGGKTPREDGEYVVLDIETTGLSYENDVIIEVGALLIRNGVSAGSYHTLVQQNVSIPQKITELTGITDDMLMTEGISEEEMMSHLIQFIGDRTLVCHNGSFDMTFLQIACRKHYVKPIKNPYIDTLILARRQLQGLPDIKLHSVARYFDLDTTGSHRAMKDCCLTFEVYEKLKKM